MTPLLGLCIGAVVGLVVAHLWSALRRRRGGDDLAATLLAGLVLQSQLRALEETYGETLEEEDDWMRAEAERTLRRIKMKLS